MRLEVAGFGYKFNMHFSSTPSLKAPFAFVHIQKCSGTAFENYMLSQGGGFDTSRAFTGLGRDERPESLEMYFKNEAASSFIFGHFYYKSLLEFCPQAFATTFVRDPVKRTISQYKSWHDEKNFHPDDPHYKVANPTEREALIFAQQASLEEFVRSENPVILNGALGNRQTIYLSTYAGEDMEGHLESAKRNLARFDFFGITEYFNESLELLRLMVPGLSDYRVEREKENRSRIAVNEFSGRVMELISGQVEYDQQLYEYACEIFRERFQARYYSIKSPYSLKWFSDGCTVEAKSKQVPNPEIDSLKIQTECESLRAQLAQLELAQLQASEENLRVSQEQQARILEAEAANNLLLAQLTHLEASHMQLRQVYNDIVESKSWRLMQALQSVLKRFISNR